MRIIHFSDTHFATCPEHLLFAFFDKRILGLTNYITRRRKKMHDEYLAETVETIQNLKPDVVVCSGDITVIGSEREFKGACKRLQPLVDDRSFEFFYIPGNHDAYCNAKNCRRALHESFARLNRNRWRLADMPQEMTIGNVSFFLLNEDRPTNIFLSTGYIDGNTKARLQEWLQKPKKNKAETKVLVGHHPSRLADGAKMGFRRRLVGGEIINAALNNGQLDIALCGHIHDSFVRRFANGALEICAGSLTMNGRLAQIDIDESDTHHKPVVNWLDRTDFSSGQSEAAARDCKAAPISAL